MRIPCWICRAAMLLALAAGLALSLKPAFGAPRATNPEQCEAIVDYTMSAAAGVERVKAELMLAFMYSEGDEQGEKLKRLIVEVAFRDLAKYEHPAVFTRSVAHACFLNRGNMDAILGADS